MANTNSNELTPEEKKQILNNMCEGSYKVQLGDLVFSGGGGTVKKVNEEGPDEEGNVTIYGSDICYNEDDNDTINKKIDSKQDILTAGSGIDITGNVISATSGEGTVKSVNEIEPDEEGNVTIDADDIKIDKTELSSSTVKAAIESKIGLEGTKIKSFKVTSIEDGGGTIKIDPTSVVSSPPDDMVGGYLLFVRESYTETGEASSSKHYYSVHKITGWTREADDFKCTISPASGNSNKENYNKYTVEEGLCLYLGGFTGDDDSNTIDEIINSLSVTSESIAFIGNSGQQSIIAGQGNLKAIDTGAAFGEDNLSLSKNSFIAGGYQNATAGRNAFSTGRYNRSYGERSFTANNNNLAYGIDAFVANLSNTGNGDRSATFGHLNHTEGSTSLLSGEGNREKGFCNFMAGGYNNINSQRTLVSGYQNIILNGMNSLIMGESNRQADSSGTPRITNSIMGGYNNQTNNGINQTLIFGYGNVATGPISSSLVIGENCVLEKSNQYVFGKYNRVTDSIFIIGNGADENNRNNIVEIARNGDTTIRDLTARNLSITNLTLTGQVLNDLKIATNCLIGSTNSTTNSSLNLLVGYLNSSTGGQLNTIVGSTNSATNATQSFIAGYGNQLIGGNSRIDSCFIEGASNQASARCVHVEGKNNSTAIEATHIEGVDNRVETGQEGMHVQGRHADIPSGHNLAHVVGGGSWGGNRNIHTIDWSGNAWYSGNIKIGGTDYAQAKNLLTEETKTTTITNNTITLGNNSHRVVYYLLQEQGGLIIKGEEATSLEGVYETRIVFKSGSTPTTISTAGSTKVIQFYGDDCNSERSFNPQSNKNYEMSVAYLYGKYIVRVGSFDA